MEIKIPQKSCNITAVKAVAVGEWGACTGLGRMVVLCWLKGRMGCCINRFVVSQSVLGCRDLLVSGHENRSQGARCIESKPFC